MVDYICYMWFTYVLFFVQLSVSSISNDCLNYSASMLQNEIIDFEISFK